MAEFFHMGGYAFYVWTSMSLTAIVLAANAIWAVRYHKQQLSRIARRIRREKVDS